MNGHGLGELDELVSPSRAAGVGANPSDDRLEGPVPFPRAVARLNRVGLNRVTQRIAAWARGLGIVVHQGRRSGRAYETLVDVFSTTDGVRIALTYGVNSDRVKNVLVAGGCCLRTRGQKLSLIRPQVVHDPMRNRTRSVERQILRLLGVADFPTLVKSHDIAEGPSPCG